MIYAAIAAVALAFVAGYWLAWWERGRVITELRQSNLAWKFKATQHIRSKP